mmetsp:Transcript_112412/g.223352  ORF Transcript_112412/g.223352 Transcript_112412/m.223352 type:complete len:105 (-) Transcript_112412:119-433(-)|eukprot:CAMPEP_0172873378 /NCGR_PEP_ID=MMETSP1075-20121228/95067_1 /TAXON_ID=2916 /ORGANISM="Ceratium fusus, Strain PA161109" /LENGTH=104 /DNA_ID=CAMNT_0013723921 /DNA_START=1 /DNA_END=315 /DNA_ORIENTATION=-
MLSVSRYLLGNKTKRLPVQLVSSVQTGFNYWTEKSPLKKGQRMALLKYDPIVNRHVMFYEAALAKSPRKGKRQRAIMWARWTGSKFLQNFMKTVVKNHERKGFF